MAVRDPILRRYTDLPALLVILANRRITLLDPASWEDKNDSYFLAQYKIKKELRSVLALCFSLVMETYHHWRVFAPGSAGVCIYFHRRALLAALKERHSIRTRIVEYLTLSEIAEKPPRVQDLPFLKRAAYRHENEYRVVYESTQLSLPALDVPIPLTCVQRIVLSPWLHQALYPQVRETIRSIKDCGSLPVVPSTLISNDRWKSCGESAES